MGVPLAVTDYVAAAAQVVAWAAECGRGAQAVYAVAAANTHVVTLARHDPFFGAALGQFELVLPDGMPLIWVMNRKRAGMKDRVYGPTFMLHALALPGVSHFFLGGSEELLATLTRKLRDQFPNLEVAGTYSPPFSPTGVWSEEETARIFSAIKTSGAHCIWVGLGCPKQELWIARNKAVLPSGVYFAIGAAFAFHAGMVRQAPGWIQKRGLEWLFRLMTEPRRLWKRYVVYNTLFLFYLLKGEAGRTKEPGKPGDYP